MTRPWKPVIAVVALALAGAGCTTVVRSNAPGNAGSIGLAQLGGDKSISDDGRFVVFVSGASNLVPGDTNATGDVFRRDNATGRTTRVSLRDDGAQIAGGSQVSGISGNGDHVAFITDDALEPADTNGLRDVYVRTVSTGTTERVSIKPDGTPIFIANRGQGLVAVSLSDDGRYALMAESEPTGGHTYVRDLVANTTVEASSASARAFLAGNGQWVVVNDACSGGPCPFTSAFVSRDGTTREPIADSCGFEAYDVSSDARYVVGRRFGVYPTFECPEPTGTVRWDRTTKQLTKVGLETTNIAGVTISDNGRFVAVLGDDEILRVADLQTGVDQVADGDAFGRRDGTATIQGQISGSGRYVGVTTMAKLSPDDTDDITDVFTRYAVTPTATAMTLATVARGADHVTVRVTGTELLPGATVVFPTGGVTVHSVVVVNPSRLDVVLSVAVDAPTGPITAVVSNTGGFGTSHALCAGCLTIG